MASILPITGVLGKRRAAHLLRRVTFGITPALVADYATKTAAQAMSALMVADTSTDKPLGFTGVSFTESAETAALATPSKLNNLISVRHFWLNKFRTGNTGFWKMVLFWNNHFAIATDGAYRYNLAHKYYLLLQKHALGNFRQFIIEMTKDPLMLFWLNGRENLKGLDNIPSNENYARELQELFTIGAAQPDGTPNYFESDVREAARVLTGWQVLNGSGSVANLGATFTLSRHDTDNKQFSSKYGSKLITGRNTNTAGDEELAELVDMILAQPACAKFICRKIYEWFVGTGITTDIETNVIGPMATTFQTGNFEIRPVIVQLLSSDHFYEDCIEGAIIKHPLDFVMNMLRLSEMPFPDPTTQFRPAYDFTNVAIKSPADDLQMSIIDHDTVFGWDAYYQTEKYKLWMSANAITRRNAQVDRMLAGIKVTGFTGSFDSIALTEKLFAAVGYTFNNKSFPDSTDTLLADKIIEGYCFYCYPKACTAAYQTELKNVLLLDRTVDEIGYWFEWKYYKDGVAGAENGLRTKLNNAVKFFWKSAEFQLV